jgi:hypothetical protein
MLTQTVLVILGNNVAKSLLILPPDQFPVALKEPFTEAFISEDIDSIVDEIQNDKVLDSVTTAIIKLAECNKIMGAAQQLTLMNDLPLNLTHDRLVDIRLEKGHGTYPCYEITQIVAGLILLASSSSSFDKNFKLVF